MVMLLMLIVVSGWAQESKASDEKTIAPIIVEGTLENVPDGTAIKIQERYGKTMGYFSVEKEGIDTLRSGKFRIVYHQNAYNPRKNVDEYLITARYNGANLTGHLELYASPGTKATVTGVGTNLMNWYAKSDNPKQIEANEYHAYFDEKLPGYWELIRRYKLSDEVDDDYYYVKKKVKESDSLYVEYMVDFMKDRKYSSVFAKALSSLSRYFLEGRNKSLRGKAAKLLSIVPEDEEKNDGFIIDAKKLLVLPKYEPIKIGEKLHDFVLYDHQDKEHHLTEFNGNGKFLLLEFNSRTCVPCMKHRPNEVLNNLYKNHSDKVDMLMVNNDDPYFWDIECKDPNKYGRDPWHEWNDKKGSEDIMQRYGLTGPAYFFVDKDGTILGRISDQEDLKAAITKYFKL